MLQAGDAVSWTTAVLSLVNDRARRASLGTLARRRAELFAWLRIAERLQQVYANVMARDLFVHKTRCSLSISALPHSCVSK